MVFYFIYVLKILIIEILVYVVGWMYDFVLICIYNFVLLNKLN